MSEGQGQQLEQDRTFVALLGEHVSAKAELKAAQSERAEAYGAVKAQVEAGGFEAAPDDLVAAIQRLRACDDRINRLFATIRQTRDEAKELDIAMWGKLGELTEDQR